MTPSSPDLKSLFCEALQRRSGPERLAYLDAACRGNNLLRAQVDDLLNAHEQASGFLDTTAEAAVTTTGTDGVPRPISEGPGTRIGHYKLLEKIGEGGMGIVYMADQEKPVRRRIALKIIKPGMDTDQVIARFEAERQALAMMDHPNIARVYDAGTTESGRPFFVMELVKGIPITEYCDEARLSTDERLKLFVSVCQAIQHAHQKGIIHRDIKPSNVLVTVLDGKPLPKVIDFGVAKAIDQRLTEKSMFTQFGAVIGTLEYMSPEQAALSALDVDTRSDIYSLGVLLYELLTGSTPLERERLRQAAFTEIVRRIKEEEPPKPSTRLSSSGEKLPSIAATRATEPGRLTRAVRGDLDWIVMKSLEKERGRRYETSNGFARDVERYLAGDPVEACPPSAAYRLKKFARKHRAGLAVAGAFALLLVGTLVLTTALMVQASAAMLRAREAERLAEQRLNEVTSANQATTQALGQTRQAQKATEAALMKSEDARKRADEARQQAEAVSTFGITLFRSPDPSVDGRSIKVADLLDGVAVKLEKEFRGPQATQGALLDALGQTYYGLSLYDKAIAVQTSACRVREAALGPNHPDTLTSRNNLAAAELAAGRTAEAIALFTSTLALRESKLGADHPHTLMSRNNLAASLHAAGRTREAAGLWESTLKRLESKLGPDDPETSKIRGNLGAAYVADGRTAEAIALWEGTLKLLEGTLGADHPDTLLTRSNLAAAYLADGRTAEAIALDEVTLERRESKLGLDHAHTLQSQNNLASDYFAAGRTAEAIKLLEPTLALRVSKLGPRHPDTLLTRNNLAAAYRDAGRAAEAIALDEATLKLRESELGPDHPDTLTTRNNLAVDYRDAERTDEAIAVFESTLKGRESKLGPNHRHAQQTRDNLAEAYEHACRWAELQALSRETLSRRRETEKADSPLLADALSQLALALVKQDRWADSEPVLRECLAIRAKVQSDDWARFNTMSQLGGVLLKLAKYAEAEPLVVQGYEGMKARETKILPRDKPRLSESAARVVPLYESWGKPEKAAEWRKTLTTGVDRSAESPSR